MEQEERNGGSITFCVGLVASATLMIGGALQLNGEGPLSAPLVIAILSVFAVFTVIAIGISCYNAGRRRGR